MRIESQRDQWPDRVRWLAAAAAPVVPENSQATQRGNTLSTYQKVHDFFDAVGAPNQSGTEGVLDYGAGLGHSGRWGHTYEPYPDKAMPPGAGNYPKWIHPEDVPAGKFNRITNIHVLNVVPPEIRHQIVDGIKNSMAPGGHAVFVTRSRSDVAGAKNKEEVGDSDPGAYHINPGHPKQTYQKGFTAEELRQYLSDRMGPGYSATVIPGKNKISAPAVHVVREIPGQRTAALTRIAIELSDEEAQLFLDFIQQSGGKMKAKLGPAEKVESIPSGDLSDLIGSLGLNYPQPSGTWYHASPHDLPEGTRLTPGGGGATSGDFYDMGFGDDTGTLQDMGAGRAGHVWLSPSEDDVHFWSAVLNAPHIYEVEPDEDPRPWNGTGTDGFVTPGARIRRKVS